LWTEDNLPSGLRPEIYERLRVPAERSDILRLELLARFGGVYIDTDFESLRPIDSLIDGVQCFAVLYRRGRLNNAIIGSIPGHPAIQAVLDELRPRRTWGPPEKEGTGPLLVDRVLRGRGDVRIFDRPLFYPESVERETAYADHHMARTWKDEAGLRRSIEIAEERRRHAERALHRLHEDGTLAAVSARAVQASRDGIAELVRKSRRAREVGADRLEPALIRTRARLAARGGHREVRIPRAMHVVQAVDLSSEGGHATATISSWFLAHPDWDVRVWSLDDAPPGLHPAIYDVLRPPWERRDILLFELLLREGGVAVAAEVPCRRRADDAAASFAAFSAADAAGVPSATCVGATAGHPAVAATLTAVEPTTWFSIDDPKVGDAALELAPAAGLTVLPPSKSPARREPRTDLDELRVRLAAAEAQQRDAELELGHAR
jgi:hypothetical protein